LADAKLLPSSLVSILKSLILKQNTNKKVVDYMIEEYQAGRTPNPDIMCNQEVSFDYS